MRSLRNKNSKWAEQARKTIPDLAKPKMPAAMYVYGKRLEAGGGFQRDPEEARDLIARAAQANWGPAMYEVGRMHRKGCLGDSPETGAPYPQNDDRARVAGALPSSRRGSGQTAAGSRAHRRHRGADLADSGI